MSSTRKRKYDDIFKVVENQHECQQCFKRFAIQGNGGTTLRKRHLEKCQNKDNEKSKMRQQTLPEMGQTSLSGILNELCVRLITKNDLPFNIVEDETFQALIRFQCPSQIKIPDRKIISNESLDKVANKFKNKLSRNINPSLPVSIQFDEYSNKRVRLITVTLTQINAKFEIKTFRLGVKSLDSLRANAGNLKELVNGILKKFEIKNVVSATRDGALNALCEMLEIPSVHCVNHIQNIAVQEGYNKLKGSKIDDIKNCVSKMVQSKLSMNILQNECNASSTLVLFTKIRWNSFAKTLRSFLKNYDALLRFEVSPAARNLSTTFCIPRLTVTELTDLKDFSEFLAVLEGLTKLAESRQCPCSTIVYICYRIQNLIDGENENVFVKNFIKGFKEKWTTYFEALMKNQIIRFSAFFDPRIMKKRYLTPEEWLQIRDEVLKLVPEERPEENKETNEKQKSSKYDDDEDDDAPQNDNASNFKKQVIAYWDYLDKVENQIGSISKKDNQWLTRIDELMLFWRTKERIWPELTAFARKFLTTTASSAEPERVFSHITQLLRNPKRNRLSAKKVEKLMEIKEYMVLEKMEENIKKNEEYEDDTTDEDDGESDEETEDNPDLFD